VSVIDHRSLINDQCHGQTYYTPGRERCSAWSSVDRLSRAGFRQMGFTSSVSPIFDLQSSILQSLASKETTTEEIK